MHVCSIVIDNYVIFFEFNDGSVNKRMKKYGVERREHKKQCVTLVKQS